MVPKHVLSWKHEIQRWRRNNSCLNRATRCKKWRIKSRANNAEQGEHRLLHRRASRERNSGQSKFHCVFAGPFFYKIRNQEGKTSWPQIWETSWKERISSGPYFFKDPLRDNSKESMIDSCEIMFSVTEWPKTIEMKMFVVHGTFLQNKITPVECQNQNTFTTGKIGGSYSISQETFPNQWENVLTSTKRCQH